jgi:uncharacterized protein
MSLRQRVFAVLLSSLPLLVGAQETVDDASRAVQRGQNEEAVRILKPLAEKGNPQAQLQLGMAYYNGRGVKENEKLAVELLTKSANQGNVEAMLQLGNAFTFGNDTVKLVADPDVEAARWYFKAASAGNADAQYTLGLLFMAGKGVERNDKEATAWMQKAAKQGHKDAQSYVSSGK